MSGPLAGAAIKPRRPDNISANARARLAPEQRLEAGDAPIGRALVILWRLATGFSGAVIAALERLCALVPSCLFQRGQALFERLAFDLSGRFDQVVDPQFSLASSRTSISASLNSGQNPGSRSSREMTAS